MLTSTPLLNLAFDIGHSSIGWAVLQSPEKSGVDPTLLGCGVVLFPADECLNSQRAAFRRQRRHIAATRNRIKRLKSLLNHLGVVPEAQLNQHPSPYSAPWFFAARVLASEGKQRLSWPELWAVLRWYAHNRGYDGNAAWARDDVTDDDTEKVEKAKGLMAEFGKKTMAETICAYLGLDPFGKTIASARYFKGTNAAFPRETVVAEVRRVLEFHRGKLDRVDDALISTLLDDWHAVPCPAIRLPQRYHGGLLFGQLVPRFDNRIIPTCRITGKKAPLKHCRAFYRYRWAMLVNNLRVADPAGTRALAPLERQKLHAVMTEAGSLTKAELKKHVAVITQADASPLDQMFLTPEMEKALVFDPVKAAVSGEALAPIWGLIPEKFQKIFAGDLFKQQSSTLAEWEAALEKQSALPATWGETVRTQTEARRKQLRKKSRESFTTESFLREPIMLKTASGRAPYTRELMEQAFAAVLGDDASRNDPKALGGLLEETPAVLERRLAMPIAQQTNNHLVRHRLLVTERTLAAIVKKYAEGDARRIAKVTIEVVRELQEFSGKTAKEMAQMLGEKLGHHRRIVEKLEKERAESGLNFKINYSLIKKARIADDLGWKCPYTGMDISIADLLPTGLMDREHIIPKSLRPSDSLESLVITYKAINKMKGRRTAMQFMRECAGQRIPDLPGKELLPLKKYVDFVESLPTRGPLDDFRRRSKRKEFLLLEKYNPREAEFTPRDLTQTAHLVKLANLQVESWFAKQSAEPAFEPIPGSVTGAVRRSWDMLGCLSQACPQIREENGTVKTKTEIRDITHLHHALDAAVLAFAAHYIPRDGKIWGLLNRRSVDDAGRKLLEATGLFTFADGNRPRMNDLPDAFKQQICDRMAEKRVVQHVPHKMSGLHAEETMWGIYNARENGKVEIRQRKVAGIRPDGTRIFKKSPKPILESKDKLWGYESPRGGKLQRLSAAYIIKDNFGVALLNPDPIVLRHAEVWKQVKNLKKLTNQQKIYYLRPGHTITVPQGIYNGIWRVRQVIGRPRGISLQISQVDSVSATDPVSAKEALLKTLLRDGMIIMDTSYVGA